jgi:hypothetical protein
MKSAKQLRANSDGGKVIQNYVHQLISNIESHFQKEGRIRRDFATAALAGALKFLEEISEAEIPTHKKIELLSKIYEAANKNIEKLATAPFENIPQWADRPKTQWRQSPCDFVKNNYPTYGKGLTSDQIADRKLLQALWNYKSKYGWPDDFDLPGKSVAVNRLLDEIGPNLNLKGLANLPPRIRRDRLRAWQARRQRSKI